MAGIASASRKQIMSGLSPISGGGIMQRLYRIVVPLTSIAAMGSVGSIASADPLPGEVLKFQQLPLNGGLPIPGAYTGPFVNPNPFPLPAGSAFPTPTAPFPGHDESSTAIANQFVTQPGGGSLAVGWQGNFMADDFADRFTSPVVHVRWWGSYLNDQSFNHVKQFLISFESDVPASAVAGSFSHPGTPLLNQIVTLGAIAPASGTYTETPVASAPGPDGPLYQYNAELNLGKEFPQQPDTVYWLKIVALVNPTVDGPISWGWHDRDWSVPNLEASVPPVVAPGESIIGSLPGSGQPVWHFQDDAVSGALSITPGSSPIMPNVLQDPATFAPHNYIDGVDGPTGIGQFSKDLAFELYTVPEPASLALIGFGALFVARRRRNRD
jgi:hypothetical protein